MPQLLPTQPQSPSPPSQIVPLSSSTLQGLPFPGPYQPPSTSRQAFSDLPRQCASPEPVVQSRPSNASSPLSGCLPEPHLVSTHRKQCIVDGCQEFIAPTMWRSHMNLHAKGVFPGEVPTWWLQEQNLTVCTNCFCLVAVSRFTSHLDKCSTIVVSGCRSFPHSSLGVSCPSENPLPALPSWEEVCELQCPTIRYIPHKARPAVARVLSDVLRSICFENSEEAWLKLFMLPKCVLRASKRGGRHCKHPSIEQLCGLWSQGDIGGIWNRIKRRPVIPPHKQNSPIDVSKKKISSAIGLGREGLLGKACQALVSPGIAPNTQEVWNSLQQKHPKGAQPSLPTSSSPPVTHVLPQDFNILSVLHSFPKGTACGPSGLRIQHLLDSAQIHLSVPLCSSLRGVVDILASGRAPISVSKFLAGGSLTALVKNKEGRPLDIRPIAVGEALRRLTGKCLCIITKPKATDFFAPLQYGVACTAGAEKVIHGVRSCIKEHWIDDNFTVCKVDMSNAFNCVSRQALLEECAVHFPELLPWVGWCYGSQPTLWHPLGQLSSEVGVQQGDPLGPLLFSLVLHKVVSYIAQDRECLPLLFNGWYLDDGVLLGHSQAVNRALTLIQKMGPSLGLFVNVSKCELFGCGDLSSFPPEMKVSRVPNLVILGAPIGDLIFCAKFVAQKRADAAVLLSQLAEVGAEDPQVAFLLLRQCAAFCKLVHLARSAPPSHIAEGLALFDKDVRQCFAECTAVDAADVEWMQAQLSLSRGGLGLRSLSSHCVAAYLASISSSGCDKWNLLVEPIELFNGLVPAEDAITLETLATSNMRQHSLSGKIEDQQFRQLFHISSPANRARLLSISSRHAASWLTVVPSPGLNLHLEPNEFQIAVKWWLGMDVSFGSCCPHCPDHRLDPLGHHALTCKHGGDVVLRHNSLRDVFVEFCHRACLGGQVEVGSGQGHDRLNSRPADVLVKNWHLGKPAAFDLTITSPLNPTTLTEAGVKCGSSAQVAEVRKHAANDGKCKELGWVCIPLAVESYGCWGMEAQESFKRLAARLASQMGCSRLQATTTLYQRLSLSLDVVFRHNKLRDLLAETCRRAHLSVQVEAGCNLTPDHSHSHPADVLISNWVLGKTAACDISVTSPLNSNIMSEAGVTAGAAAQATELRKHEANDVKCSELGWLCIPLVVESYGAWGKEAMESFSSLASRLAITSSRPRSAVLSELYGRLNLNLVRANTHLKDPSVHCALALPWTPLDIMPSPVEAGNDLTADHSHTRPADLLLTNWATGKTAAFDISVTSPLNTLTLLEAGVAAGSAAQATETRKHMANDAKCNELGWLCVPLVAETYGAWGKEAMEAFSQLASRLATHTCKLKSAVTFELYSRLNLHLNRAASSSHSNKTTRVRPNDGVTSAISLSKDGLCGKACRLLVSQGVAPNNESTWNLLISKHPKGGCPVGLPGAPNDGTLPPDFNLGPVLRSFPKLTGAGPSGLRIQHLLDAVEVPLQTPILHSLKAVVNILSSGRAPALISPFLAGGNLTALVKSKDSCASDIRPIAVGETLRRLTAKCLCAVVKAKAAEFFQPHQFGVSCSMGAEKIAHGLRACVDRQWKDEGFSVLKLDMRNAFNVVSRPAFLSECSLHFPELYPWVLWCYSQHPILWHPMGTLTSECGVQQGDPLGPLLFCLVLNILVKDICSDPNCANLSFHSWYLDDGVVAGPSLAVQKVFSPTDVNLFREFCSNYISNKCASAKLLLHKLEEVGAQDAQVALVLLRLCGSFCKLAHLARATPPSLSIKALELFDIDVRHCFSQCTAVDTSDEAWLQAQLSLSRGGLGLRSLSSHAAAAYIASLCSSDFSSLSSLHLTSAIGKFNSSVSPSDVVSVESFAQRPPIQKDLSAKIDDFQFNQLFNSSSLADRARLLSISSPHASSWLSVVPSEGLGLHLNPDQFQVAIKWWLGLDTSGGSLCSLCPDTVLDPLGHHASTCKRAWG
eukprot:Em0017g310a